jgi:hypothetical protein
MPLNDPRAEAVLRGLVARLRHQADDERAIALAALEARNYVAAMIHTSAADALCRQAERIEAMADALPASGD